jgi:hypothetical protein
MLPWKDKPVLTYWSSKLQFRSPSSILGGNTKGPLLPPNRIFSKRLTWSIELFLLQTWIWLIVRLDQRGLPTLFMTFHIRLVEKSKLHEKGSYGNGINNCNYSEAFTSYCHWNWIMVLNGYVVKVGYVCRSWVSWADNVMTVICTTMVSMHLHTCYQLHWIVQIDGLNN